MSSCSWGQSLFPTTLRLMYMYCSVATVTVQLCNTHVLLCCSNHCTTAILMYMYYYVAAIAVQLCHADVHVLLCCSNRCTTLSCWCTCTAMLQQSLYNSVMLMYMYCYVAAIAVQLCHADVHVLLCCSNHCTTLQYWCTCTAMLQQSLYNSAILMQESGDPRDRSEALKRYGHIISIVCIHIKLLLSVVYCMLVSPELSVKKKQCV